MDDTKDLEFALSEIEKVKTYNLKIVLLCFLWLTETIFAFTEIISVGIFVSLVFVNLIVYYFFEYKKKKIMSNVQSILDENV